MAQTGHTKTNNAITLRATLALCATALFLLTFAGPAQATKEHTFDPLLSLRGDCTAIALLDEVADPGLCPMPPGVAGVDHPPKAFEDPCGSAADRHGDIYVSSAAVGNGSGTEGRIDVFNPKGEYLTEIKDEKQPCKIAVDSQGNVYVVEGSGNAVLFKAKSFPPAKGATYQSPLIVREPKGTPDEKALTGTSSLAVDPSDDHLFAANGEAGSKVFEYSSAAEGSDLIGGVDEVQRLAVDASGGSFKLVSFSEGSTLNGWYFTADLTAGSSVVTSIHLASGTGTLTAGSTEVTSLETTSGTFSNGEPISGPGIPEGIGTGDLSPGSNVVTNVSVKSGAFAVGERVFAPGLPDGRGGTITAVGAGTLTLSEAVPSGGEPRVGAPILAATTIEEVIQGNADRVLRLSLPASASGAAVGLVSKGDPGASESALVLGHGVPPGAYLRSLGPNQLAQGSGVLIGNTGTGDLSAGSNVVTNLSVEKGAFAVGQTFFGRGVPEGTTITALGAGTLTLSEAATETLVKQGLASTTEASASGAAVPITTGTGFNAHETAALPYNASAASVQGALEALPGIGAGNVSVSGGPGGPGAANPYLIAYQGKLANTDVPPLGAEGSGLSGSAASAALSTETIGSDGAIGEVRRGYSPDAPTRYDIAVWGKNHDIYATGKGPAVPGVGPGEPQYARAFVIDSSDGQVKCETHGADAPQGGFGFAFGKAGVTVDQANGDLYVDDVVAHGVVDQLDSECHYLGQLEHSLAPSIRSAAGLAVDDPFPGQAGYDSPNEGELYVAQGTTPKKLHLYAFAGVAEEAEPEAPEVRGQEVAGVTETEAVLEAQVNPKGTETTYRFQYTTQAAFEEHGYEGAAEAPVPDADAGSDAFFKQVSQPIFGLAPATAYRYRLIATSHCVESEPEALCVTTGEGKAGEEGEDAAFTTYGPEAGPPDERGYELVSPPDTNGLTPTVGIGNNSFSVNFATALVSPDGQSVSFGTEGGSLPGFEGGGFHDVYTATRGPGGWTTSFAGLNGAQAPRNVFPGGIAPDHRYSFWDVGEAGTLARGHYLRGPEGVEPIGIGSLGEDLEAEGRWIGEGGGEIVFLSSEHNPVQLEPNAGPGAIYERSADGPTEVLSLLPGDLTPTEGADYKGTSADGGATAFEIGKSLYVRLGGAETQLVAEGEPTFGGVSAHGERIAYLRLNPTEAFRPNPVKTTQPVEGPPQGEIFTYDTETEETTALASGDKAVLVNVSPDGSHVYFDSPERLDGLKGTPGAENLYVWDAETEAIRFIATVTARDVYGSAETDATGVVIDGLGLWARYVTGGQASSVAGPGSDPSRSSADGRVLLFESRARLTPYDNAEHAEIYRYDAASEALECLSCAPTGAPAGSDASLQSIPPFFLRSLPPVNNMAEVINLTPDGARALFQSSEPLVVGDVDGLQDVYEWEAPGKGTCTEESPAFQPAIGGCLYLISGGRGATEDYLYGMTPDGSDVVFLSGDLLSFEDHDKTPSLYDARVGGGFQQPPPPPGECLGEACQPTAVAPDDPTPASSSFEGAGNVREEPIVTKPRCPKGKRAVRAKGKTRCVKPHRKHPRHRRRANAKRRAAR